MLNYNLDDEDDKSILLRLNLFIYWIYISKLFFFKTKKQN